MILISVKSEVVQDKRQFKSDSAAMRFLKRINKLHNSHRLAIVGKKPKAKDFRTGRKGYSRLKYLTAIEEWEANMKQTLGLKVEIINTKANQLNLSI
jgi:hypothetical protein